ncbi:MAG: AbrB/MazE/SpoVT family DNA-binding domain-containing protein [Zoogloeaceae bacterium]|jgi:bifunctional DNA-binding transcriptional regulator/antitoxin component of YhaV-PrlF toxin-antitoxin module|nr:AbrB/MazE/SpoVT family DNA-binding domain-containing protein [Zoogloeaceae bacterium]
MDFALSRTGQFTVNKALLSHLGVKPGDRVSVEMLPDASLRVSALGKKRPLSELRTAFRQKFGTAPSLSLDEIERAIEEGCLASGMAGTEK